MRRRPCTPPLLLLLLLLLLTTRKWKGSPWSAAVLFAFSSATKCGRWRHTGKRR